MSLSLLLFCGLRHKILRKPQRFYFRAHHLLLLLLHRLYAPRCSSVNRSRRQDRKRYKCCSREVLTSLTFSSPFCFFFLFFLIFFFFFFLSVSLLRFCLRSSSSLLQLLMIAFPRDFCATSPPRSGEALALSISMTSHYFSISSPLRHIYILQFLTEQTTVMTCGL